MWSSRCASNVTAGRRKMAVLPESPTKDEVKYRDDSRLTGSCLAHARSRSAYPSIF